MATGKATHDEIEYKKENEVQKLNPNFKNLKKLTVRRRLTPLRPAVKCPSWGLLPERENMDTRDPSSW